VAPTNILLELVKGDVIVDKMHIHYGKKDKNPVNYMRFFPKDAEELTAVAKKGKDVCMCVYMCMCMCMCMCMRVCICVYVCMYMCVYVRVCIYVYMCICGSAGV
jgi:hypothetical protein